MSRRTSRRQQQSMNEWRRTGRTLMLLAAGIPVEVAPGACYIPPDPERERQEFVRQIAARMELEPGQPAPMQGYIGTMDGFRVIASEPG